VTLEQRLVDAFIERHPLEAARAMERLPLPELVALLTRTGTAAERALRLMASAPLAAVLGRLAADTAGRLVSVLPLAGQLSVLHLVDPGQREAILQALDGREAALLNRLLSYPKQSAASLVEFDTFRVASDTTAGEALEQGRSGDVPVHYYVYVVDRDHHLVGVLSLKELMRAGPTIAVFEIMHRNPARIAATDTVFDVAANHRWRRFPMLPVVDGDERLVGVILYETIQRLREGSEYDAGWAGTRETLIALSEVYWLGLSAVIGTPAEGRYGR
jgi:magnesium transporter